MLGAWQQFRRNLHLFEKINDHLTDDDWLNLFNTLVDNNPYLKGIYPYYFVDAFLDFLLSIVEDSKISEEIDKKIEQAKMYSPDYIFYFDSSYKNLLAKYPNLFHKWAWQALEHNLGRRGRKVVEVISYPLLIDFLLPFIKENYTYFWDTYVNYLKKLFRIKEYSIDMSE